MEGYTDYLLRSKYLYNETFTKNENIGENIFFKSNDKFKKEVFNEDELEKDDTGYFYTVTRGGGILLSALLQRMSNSDTNSGLESDSDSNVHEAQDAVSEPTNETANNSGPAIDYYYNFNQSVVAKIKSAHENDIITVEAGNWPGFMRMVFEALNERPDVTLVVNCSINGIRKELTIPAGRDLLSEIGNAENVTFSRLFEIINEQ